MLFSHLDNVQMLSHGSADLILEACTDFWDGSDIYPLSGSDRSETSPYLLHFQQMKVFRHLLNGNDAGLALLYSGARKGVKHIS